MKTLISTSQIHKFVKWVIISIFALTMIGIFTGCEPDPVEPDPEPFVYSTYLTGEWKTFYNDSSNPDNPENGTTIQTIVFAGYEYTYTFDWFKKYHPDLTYTTTGRYTVDNENGMLEMEESFNYKENFGYDGGLFEIQKIGEDEMILNPVNGGEPLKYIRQ